MLTLHSRLQLRALIQPNPVLHLMGSGIHSTPRTLPSPTAAAAAACCYALLHHCRPPLPRRRESLQKLHETGKRESARIIILSVGFVQSFHTMNGKAYLFNNVVNISVGVHEEKMMMTGMHTVADISCVGCGSIVGWRYETAHEKAQKYKEGKSVLQRIKISGPDGSNYGSDADDA